jgi:hypothetical protein
MEKVYEHEYRTTTFGSPSKDGSQRDRVAEYRREVRTSRSPISGTKRTVEERVQDGSGRKTTTIVYDGPHGTSTTTVYRRDEDPIRPRTPTRAAPQHRHTDKAEPADQGRATLYSSTVSQASDIQSVYDKYSPSRAKHASGTKVVYEGDPVHADAKVAANRTRAERERDAEVEAQAQAGRAYKRTTVELSPGRRVERTVEYANDDSREPERHTYTRVVREEPKVTTIERTITGSPSKRYERTEVVREERKPSPSKTLVTRITRDSPYGKHTTEITRTVEDPQPERTVYSRTVRETSPNRYEVTHKTVRDSPVGKSEIVTRTIRDEDGEQRTSTYVRRAVHDGDHDGHHHHHHDHHDHHHEEPLHSSSYTRTVVNRKADEVSSYSRTEISPSHHHHEESYPRRVRPSDAEDDVVVLKYTSPYKK